MSLFKIVSILLLLLPAPLLADDPVLTEEFFEQPAAQDTPDAGMGGDDLPYLEEPPPMAQDNAPREPLFIKHSFSGGIALGAGTFGLRVNVQSFFNEYFLLENQVFYRNEQGSLDDLDYSLENYGLDSYLVAQYRIGSLVTPFAGVGPGFEIWSRLYDGFEFDSGNSLIGSYFLGANLHLGKNFILQVRHVTKHYLTDQQIDLDDRKTKLPDAISYLQVGFLIVI